MSPPTKSGANSPWNPTIRAIARQNRRETLSAMLRLAPVTEKSLAGYLAAQIHGTPSPTEERIHSAHMELVHRHLPMLTEAGLTKWDAESGTVDTTTHPALSDHRFTYLLRLDHEGVDGVFDAISHEYPRIVLTALWEGKAEQSETTLAKKIAHCRYREGAPETGPIDEIAVALHHAHFPKLADYDLIEHDPEASRVAYAGHPAVEEVLAIIYEPDDYLVDRYGGLLSGLLDSYRTAEPDQKRPAGWPHHWRLYYG